MDVSSRSLKLHELVAACQKETDGILVEFILSSLKNLIVDLHRCLKCGWCGFSCFRIEDSDYENYVWELPNSATAGHHGRLVPVSSYQGSKRDLQTRLPEKDQYTQKLYWFKHRRSATYIQQRKSCRYFQTRMISKWWWVSFRTTYSVQYRGRGDHRDFHSKVKCTFLPFENFRLRME